MRPTASAKMQRQAARCNKPGSAGMRVLDGEYKLRQAIRIAMLYLEDDDAVSAEMFIKKAATLIAASKVGAPPAAAAASQRGLSSVMARFLGVRV